MRQHPTRYKLVDGLGAKTQHVGDLAHGKQASWTLGLLGVTSQ